MIVLSKQGPSNGAVALTHALREAGERVLLSNRREFPRARQLINWGSHAPILAARGRVLNTPDSVAVSRNKLSAFNALKDINTVNVPAYWTSKEDVERERPDIVFERHSLAGEAGSGIVIKRRGEALSDHCPLYVRYVRKRREYRVHVFDGQAIAVQQKRKASKETTESSLIRSHDNGYVFCVNSVDEAGLDAIKTMAVEAVKALGLDFGAVDMVVGMRDNIPYVLEVNTKPGLESPTVIGAYVSAIRRVYGS